MAKVLRCGRSFTIRSSNYGQKLLGTKVYFEGQAKPRFVKDDGSFPFGKNILEILSQKFGQVRLVLTREYSGIRKVGKTHHVHIPSSVVSAMSTAHFSRNRDLKERVIQKRFSELYPSHFQSALEIFRYEKGLFREILTKTFLPTRLSEDDCVALAGFYPRFLASGVAKAGASSPSDVRSEIEIRILEECARELKTRIESQKDESGWQKYLEDKILLIQQGYIEAIPKANIGLIGTQYPDFLFVTFDGYLDILEIKTPFTPLLKEDPSHHNFYWDKEVSKAIAQTENYIQSIVESGPLVRSKISDRYKIELRVVKPRGIILAGNLGADRDNKKKIDDFRLLNEGLKNVSVVTYDELLRRLQNFISVLVSHRGSR